MIALLISFAAPRVEGNNHAVDRSLYSAALFEHLKRLPGKRNNGVLAPVFIRLARNRPRWRDSRSISSHVAFARLAVPRQNASA